MNKTLNLLAEKFSLSLNAPVVEIHGINRTLMAQFLYELDFQEGAEIGVAEGNHAKVLCESIPNVKLHLIDVWTKYPGYEEYQNPEDCFEEAKRKLKDYNCIFINKFSMDAVKDYKDKSLDFVYIDSAHDFRSIAEDISEWSKKVKVGGIVFGHDYKQHKSYMDKGKLRYPVDVKPVVQAYCQAKNIQPLFVLTNDIRDPVFGRDNPGWAFVRTEENSI